MDAKSGVELESESILSLSAKQTGLIGNLVVRIEFSP